MTTRTAVACVVLVALAGAIGEAQKPSKDDKIVGQGTTNRVPKFIGVDRIGDSSITDGQQVTIEKGVTVATDLTVGTNLSVGNDLTVEGRIDAIQGILGRQIATSPAVTGTSNSTTGVQGVAISGIGVDGTSVTNAGVRGFSNEFIGVSGTSASGIYAGVQGVNTSGGVGVGGSGGHTGVSGFGSTLGVFGQVNGAAPCEECLTGFFSAAVLGVANHQHAVGIQGHNVAAYGAAVRGFSDAANGVGIEGFATNGGAGGSFYNSGTGDLVRGASFNGSFVFRGNGDLEITGLRAIKPGGGSWTVPSDARLKHSIEPIASPLSRLLSLRGVTFEYIDPASIGQLPGVKMGMVAQEVEQVFPAWVDEGTAGHKLLTFRGFEALVVEAVRELKDATAADATDLEARIEALERENRELRDLVKTVIASSRR